MCIFHVNIIRNIPGDDYYFPLYCYLERSKLLYNTPVEDAFIKETEPTNSLGIHLDQGLTWGSFR